MTYPNPSATHPAPRSLFGDQPDSTVERESGLVAIAFALTIFLSAFLLFQVQPLIGKSILPWFGGTPGVWTTCMLFFQLLLFAGSAYAHLTSTFLRPRAQAVVHALVLLASCLALPIIPAAALKPVDSAQPVLRIVILLAATVGIPFFVLSSTGPLLQIWFSRTHSGRSPYRLYALSNAGALLALISYPAVFDLLFPLRLQAHMWSGAFVGFAILCSACALALARRHDSEVGTHSSSPLDEPGDSPPSLGRRVLWFLLAMVPSVLLLATTNQVCLEIASVPFLWVLPLTLYLLSFILCFDSDRWHSRRFLMPLAIASLGAAYWILENRAEVSLFKQIVVLFSTLFLSAMVCHAELVRLRPHARRLTSFYLIISAGGAAGGIFVGVVAPLIFHNYHELQVGLFAGAALMLVVLASDPTSHLYGARPRWVWLVMLAALSAFGVGLVENARGTSRGVVEVSRNFYGVLRVIRTPGIYENVPQSALTLLNGRNRDGFEYNDPELRGVPTTYYNPESGVGRVLNLPSSRPRRVGLVGLGIGTLTAYARPGDQFQFFEINSKVEEIARKHFHYLANCAGKVDVVTGDARLALERAEPMNLDLLVLDAFSGESIPMHLLTVEAFAIYRKHLAPDGIIAVNITNRHFNLRPVIDAVANENELPTLTAWTDSTARGGDENLWVLVAHQSKYLKPFLPYSLPLSDSSVLWTDDHSSLLEVLY